MSTAALSQVEPSQAGAPNETHEQALVPSPPSPEAEPFIPPHSLAARLPVEVDVAIPLRGFRVRNLLALDTGTVVESQWGHGDDVPLGSGDVQLAWSEFEVVDTQLAVRLTRLV
jgi:flagellar motor switch/type III secretory pathway protein FliN